MSSTTGAYLSNRRAAPSVTAADIGLLAIRVPTGLLLAGHGTQKLFGWFGGAGIADTARFFKRVGYVPERPFAILAGCCELLGGLGLALGLFTPLAAAAVAGTMLNAAGTTWSHGLWAQNGGFEYAMVLASVAVGLAFTGPGGFALDRRLPWARGSIRYGAYSVAAAAITGAVALAVKNL